MRNRIALLTFSGLALMTFFGLKQFSMPGSVAVSIGGLLFGVVSQRAVNTFLDYEDIIDGDTGSTDSFDLLFGLAPGLAYFILVAIVYFGINVVWVNV